MRAMQIKTPCDSRGELLGFSSANPHRRAVSYRNLSHLLWEAQAVMRTKKAGTLKVYVSSEGQTTKKESVVVGPRRVAAFEV